MKTDPDSKIYQLIANSPVLKISIIQLLLLL